MAQFQVQILAVDRTFYQGPCESITVPTSDGEIGIWANHSPVIAAVRPGTLRFRTPDGQEVTVATSPGMLKVENNHVLVLVDSVERPEEIDAARAQREADEAREALLQKRSMQEYQMAQATLARAANRLRVKSSFTNMNE